MMLKHNEGNIFTFYDEYIPKTGQHNLASLKTIIEQGPAIGVYSIVVFKLANVLR